MSRNKLRVSDRRIEDAQAALGQRRRGPQLGSPAMIGQVVDGGAKPKSVPGEFLIQPYRVSFTEAEGRPVTLTSWPGAMGNARVPVSVLHSAVPPTGSPLIARLQGGRWTSLYGRPQPNGLPPCCQCVPAGLILHSDLTTGESASIGLGGWFSEDEDMRFSYRPSPVRSIGFVASGFDPEGNVFFYREAPEFGWWTDQLSKTITTMYSTMHTETYWYWLMPSGCSLSIVQVLAGNTVYPTFEEMVALGGAYWCTLLDEAVALDAVFAAGGAVDALNEISASMPRSCDDFDVPVWTFEKVILGTVPLDIQEVATDTLDLAPGDGGYGNGYYYGNCISLNETSIGTSHNITDLQGQ